AIANQKGGVGKTTTTVNLAASLARMGKDVLVVDLDPQGNATTGSGVDKNQLEFGVYDILFDESSVKKAILHSKEGQFDILGSNRSLVGAEIELVQELAREMKLKLALNTVKDKYDYILIDSPPTLTLLTINGLVAADFILVPMVCEYYALEGISDLIATINKIKKSKINPSLEIIGLVRTMFDSRNNLSKEVSGQLEEYFESDLFKTTIPRNIKLAEAPSHGLPVIAYDKNSKGAQSYLDLAKELNKKIKKLS
ncbi:MAG: AAA family ATPase, partial [Neisseriaceae bacterium]|nr:AAA family ATPase [Neisseriaceae bacterium]